MTRKDLQTQLQETQTELRAAQTHISELEAQLARCLSNGTLPLSHKPAVSGKELAMAERYQRIVENQSELICHYTTDFHLTFVNRAYAQRFDKTPEDLIGKSVLDMLPEAERAQTTATIYSLSPESPVRISEQRFEMPNGAVRWYQWREYALRDNRGKVIEFQGVGRDITDEKLLQTQLQASRDQLNNILNSIEDVVWSITLPVFNIVYLSPSISRLLERPLQELQHSIDWLAQILSAEDYRDLEARFGTALETGFGEAEYRVILPDGRVRWTQMRFWVQYDVNGKPAYMHGIASDITEQRHFATGLQEAHNLLEQRVVERTMELNRVATRFEAILNSSSEGILLLDLEQGAQQANQAFEAAFGYEDVPYQGLPLTELVHPDEVSSLDIAMRSVVEHNTMTQLELRAKRSDGTFFDVEVSVAPVKQLDASSSVVCSFHDITERRMYENALQQYAIEVSDLYNNAPCGYHSLNAEGLFVRINDTELEWLGYTQDEVVGKLKFSDLLTPEGQRKFHAGFPTIEKQKDIECELLRRDGSILPVILNISVIRDEQGKFVMTRTTVFDSTELKKAQQALRESEAQYRLLAEHTSDFVMLHTADGKALYASPSYLTRRLHF
ncbi:MAG: PAS domain S-box protein [Anaerolineae bacterium]